MDTSTNTTTEQSTEQATRRVGQQVRRAHAAAIQFGVWGPQNMRVQASRGGGREGLPYVAVTIGDCLTYVYDRDALASYLGAWREAARVNRAMRLGEFGPLRQEQREFACGEDFAVVCNVTGERHTSVSARVEASGRPVMTVIVGAVTTTVHTTTALRSYVEAWTLASKSRAILAQTL